MRILPPLVVPALLLLLAGPAQAELRIQGELKLPAHRLVRLRAAGDLAGAALIWDISPEESADLEEVGSRLLFAAPPGVYRVKLRALRVQDGKTSVETARATVVIGEPVPPGPVPPVPPVPPGPGPVPPGPAPIPLEGLRVLVVYESAELPKLPPGQQAVLYARSIRDYLDRKCVVGADTRTREWRMWDRDSDASGEAKHWQDALKRDRKSVPWIVISTGRDGYEGPLPASVAETLALLKKYGGE